MNYEDPEILKLMTGKVEFIFNGFNALVCLHCYIFKAANILWV